MNAQISLKVSPEDLRQAASGVSSMANALQSDFDSLQRLVERTRYYWLGAAGDQYRSDFAARKQVTEHIIHTLRKYPIDLLQMAQIYDAAETGNTRSLGSLPSNIL